MNTQTNTKSNFGAKGWLTILVTGVMLYFYSSFCTDGLNVIVGNFSAAHGLDSAALLGLTTPAAWTGVVGAVIWALFVDKVGARTGILVTGILGGISFLLYGVVSTAMGFFLVTALVNFVGVGFSTTAGYTLIANWFPLKKGLALGWATMGQNLASATFVPLFLLAMHQFALNGAFFCMGIAQILLSILRRWAAPRTTEASPRRKSKPT